MQRNVSPRRGAVAALARPRFLCWRLPRPQEAQPKACPPSAQREEPIEQWLETRFVTLALGAMASQMIGHR